MDRGFSGPLHEWIEKRLKRSAIDALALMEPPSELERSEGGSHGSHWWRRRESNPRPRTCRKVHLRA